MVNENIAKIYAALIQKRKKEIESLPEDIKPLVEKILRENGV